MPAPGRISPNYARGTADHRRGGEIGPLDKLHKIANRRVGIVNQMNSAVNNLADIVRRYIGSHTDRDTYRAVYEKIWEPRREHRRFFQLVVKVRSKINDIFFNVAHHFGSDARKSRFRITVCSRGVAVDGTKVTLTVDKRIAHRKRLRHSHQSIVNRRVSVRMIATQHITNRCSRLAVRVVVGQSILIHGVKNAPVYRFKAVAYIRQRSCCYNRHCILKEGGFYLPFHINVGNFLVFELYVSCLTFVAGTHFYDVKTAV